MDCDLWIRIGTHFTVRGIPGLIANFRTHSTSKTHDIPLPSVMERYRIAKRYGATGNAAPAAELLMYRWSQFLTQDFGKDHREWIENDWARMPAELSALLQPSKRYVTSKAYLQAALAHAASGRLSSAGICFWNAVKEDPFVVLRDGGILLSVLRTSRRLLRACRRRFTGAGLVSSG